MDMEAGATNKPGQGEGGGAGRGWNGMASVAGRSTAAGGESLPLCDPALSPRPLRIRKVGRVERSIVSLRDEENRHRRKICAVRGARFPELVAFSPFAMCVVVTDTCSMCYR